MVKSMLEQDTDVKDKQMKMLQETIRNLQTQLLENSAKEKESTNRIGDLEGRLRQANVKELLLKTKIVEATTKQLNNHINSMSSSKSSLQSAVDFDDAASSVHGDPPKCLAATEIATTCQPVTMSPPTTVGKAQIIHPDEARIIGLVSTFLAVHPFGASLDYVYSYVQRSAPHLRPKQLEEILSRHDTTFSEEVTGVGAKIERKWKFCGFDIEQEE